MKIGIVTMYYTRNVGIARGVVERAERFAREHEVHVFFGKGDPPQDSNITFHKVPLPPSTWSGYLSSLSFFVMTGHLLRRERYDILQLHAHAACSADVVTCHALPSAGLRRLELSETLSAGTGYTSRRVLRYRVLRPILEYNYRPGRYKKIVATSRAIKAELKDLCGIPDEDIVCIPNGVDLEHFHPHNRDLDRKALRDQLGLREYDVVLLFVGNYFRRKGLGFLLDALASMRCKHAKLIVAGHDGVDGPEFVGKAKSLGLERQVIFAGAVKGEIARYYAASDLFVFPSIYEGFALVILEAMATGLPAVVSKLGAPPELIQDGVNGLLLDEVTDVSALADRIAHLIDQPALRQRIGQKARETAEAYSWDRVAGETLKLYEDILAQKMRAR